MLRLSLRTYVLGFLPAALVALHGLTATAGEYKSGKNWPEPAIIDPGPVGGPPSDAIILFDGKDMSKWKGAEKWIVKDGVATVHGGGIQTVDTFGDCQLHVEWASPEEVKGHGQGRGNSGVFMMGKYEIQVLDSYDNKTYYDGQAGAIYKQHPPLVNACRKPGEWQTYDIIWEAPKFASDGKVEKPAYVTVLQNGVLIQNHTEVEGSTSWNKPPAYEKHGEKEPIALQDHGNPVRYRNIWIRELHEQKPLPGPSTGPSE